MTTPDWLLLINLTSTLYMFGVIVVVQIVLYPLFSGVGYDDFMSYHRQHVTRMGAVVGLPMVIELLSAALLLCFIPQGVSSGYIYFGLILVTLVWVVTLCFSIPAHHRLKQGFDVSSHRLLVRSNWFRTAAWLGRVVLVLLMIRARLMV